MPDRGKQPPTGGEQVAPPDATTALAAELDAQPALLRELASRWETFGESAPDVLVRRPRRVALLGLGSSRDAALAGQWLMRASGIDATVHMPSESLDGLPSESLVIVVSASGATPALVVAARRLAERCTVVSVTREPESPLARLADLVVPLHCDPEPSGIAVWSFLASIASLVAMSELLASGSVGTVPTSLRAAADELLDLRAAAAVSIEDAATRVRAASFVHVVAPLGRLGPALQAAQVLREVPRLPAVAVAAEDWDHAHSYLTVDPGYLAIVSGPTDADAELLRWVVGRDRQLLALGVPLVEGGAGIEFRVDDPLVRLLIECPLMESVALRASGSSGTSDRHD